MSLSSTLLNIVRYDGLAFDLFTEVFDVLPLGHIIGEKILVVHGGLFEDDGVKIETLQKIDRKREPPNGGMLAGMNLHSN